MCFGYGIEYYCNYDYVGKGMDEVGFGSVILVNYYLVYGYVDS